MKKTCSVASTLLSVVGLLASQGALGQTQPTRNATQVPTNPAPPVPAATPPAPAQPPAMQPAPIPVNPQAPPPTVTAMPGQPYMIIDPATGQQVPVVTYGPVVRQRPAVLPYVEGSPVPRGYMLEEYHPRGLIIGGAVTLAVLYSISFSVAASNNFDNANGWLAVPVIGPFGWLAARKTPTCGTAPYTYTCDDESSNRTMVALDGMAQAAGAAMLIAGLAITRKHLLLVDPQDVIVAPYASPSGSGLNIIGRF